jgi:3-oxoacyl-[acyl-carrier-protein] synthase II
MRDPEEVQRQRTRVVVTGLGVVSPIGVGTEVFWRAALSGRVGTSTITQFDTSAFLTSKGGEVKDFEPGRFIRKLRYEDLSRSTQFAVAVTSMALEDAGLLNSGAQHDRMGVCFGVVIGNRPSIESAVSMLHAQRGQAIDGFCSTTSHDPTMISRMPAIEFGLAGPNVVIPTACAAGNGAIGYAMDMIRADRADVMVAGGADEMSLTMFMMFNSFRALAPDVVQPFDKNRRGLMLSEGAAALLLESYEHAKNRGAFIYGEVLGHGNFADAHHMTAPHPEGLGAIRSMQAALKMSGVSPEEIDYISAHGTGTPLNDLAESRAIRTVFGRAADSIPVSSIKSMLGHTQGAASAIEAATCLLTIRDHVIPPTMNHAETDPECALDIVANAARPQTVNIALNNAFGFGGNISCTVFSSLRGM